MCVKVDIFMCTVNAKKEQLKWTVALIPFSSWHCLENIFTISAFRSSSRVDILLHFEVRTYLKKHCAEYVINKQQADVV